MGDSSELPEDFSANMIRRNENSDLEIREEGEENEKEGEINIREEEEEEEEEEERVKNEDRRERIRRYWDDSDYSESEDMHYVERNLPYDPNNSKDGRTEGSDQIDRSDMRQFRSPEDSADIELQRDGYEHFARLLGKPPQRGCSRPFEDEPVMSLPSPGDPIAPLEDYTIEVPDPYNLNIGRYNESPLTAYEEISEREVEVQELDNRIKTREEILERYLFSLYRPYENTNNTNDDKNLDSDTDTDSDIDSDIDQNSITSSEQSFGHLYVDFIHYILSFEIINSILFFIILGYIFLNKEYKSIMLLRLYNNKYIRYVPYLLLLIKLYYKIRYKI